MLHQLGSRLTPAGACYTLPVGDMSAGKRAEEGRHVYSREHFSELFNYHQDIYFINKYEMRLRGEKDALEQDQEEG